MILLDNILCPAHDVTVNLRKYMMITTIVTPKLIDLLDMILMQNHTEHTKEHIRELKENCKTCISDCRKAASVSNKISPDILRMTASLYALWDNITVVAPIKEKVLLLIHLCKKIYRFFLTCLPPISVLIMIAYYAALSYSSNV